MRGYGAAPDRRGAGLSPSAPSREQSCRARARSCQAPDAIRARTRWSVGRPPERASLRQDLPPLAIPRVPDRKPTDHAEPKISARELVIRGIKFSRGRMQPQLQERQSPLRLLASLRGEFAGPVLARLALRFPAR